MADEIISKDKAIALTTGIFILLATLGAVYFIDEGDVAYGCNATGEEIVGLCFKLSAVNDYGTQTRCYYNESAPRKYKNCGTGWYETNYTQAKGDVVELTDYVDVKPFEIKKDFTAVKDIEDYITDELKSDIKSEVTVIKTVQKPYNDEIEVHWEATLFKESLIDKEICINESCEMNKVTLKEIIYSEVLTTKFNKNATDEEIAETIEQHAIEFSNGWKPNIEIEIEVTEEATELNLSKVYIKEVVIIKPEVNETEPINITV